MNLPNYQDMVRGTEKNRGGGGGNDLKYQEIAVANRTERHETLSTETPMKIPGLYLQYDYPSRMIYKTAPIESVLSRIKRLQHKYYPQQPLRRIWNIAPATHLTKMSPFQIQIPSSVFAPSYGSAPARTYNTSKKLYPSDQMIKTPVCPRNACCSSPFSLCNRYQESGLDGRTLDKDASFYKSQDQTNQLSGSRINRM